MTTKIIKKYTNACLTSCGDKAHKNGCYLKFKQDKVENSEEREVIVDYNKKGEILGIDFITN